MASRGALCRPYQAHPQVPPFPKDFRHGGVRFLPGVQFVRFINNEHDMTPGQHFRHDRPV